MSFEQTVLGRLRIAAEQPEIVTGVTATLAYSQEARASGMPDDRMTGGSSARLSEDRIPARPHVSRGDPSAMARAGMAATRAAAAKVVFIVVSGIWRV